MSKPRRIWGFKTMLPVALRKDLGPEQYQQDCLRKEKKRGASCQGISISCPPLPYIPEQNSNLHAPPQTWFEEQAQLLTMFVNLPLFTLGLEQEVEFPESPSEIARQLWLEAQLLTPGVVHCNHCHITPRSICKVCICLLFLQTLTGHLQGNERKFDA